MFGCSASFTEPTDTLSLPVWKKIDQLMKKIHEKGGRDVREDLMLTQEVV